jgi:hypothetical protein
MNILYKRTGFRALSFMSSSLPSLGFGVLVDVLRRLFGV